LNQSLAELKAICRFGDLCYVELKRSAAEPRWLTGRVYYSPVDFKNILEYQSLFVVKIFVSDMVNFFVLNDVDISTLRVGITKISLGN
jgi:hypothetical protein